MRENKTTSTISVIIRCLLWAVFVVCATMFVSWETDFEKMGNDARFSMVCFILIDCIVIYSLDGIKENYNDYNRR